MVYPPCMVVLPWEQRADGYLRYRWWPDPVLGAELWVPYRARVTSSVAELKEMFSSPIATTASEVWGRAHQPDRAELTVHHGPIAGLFIAWESRKMPTLEQMAMFVPEDWDRCDHCAGSDLCGGVSATEWAEALDAGAGPHVKTGGKLP